MKTDIEKLLSQMSLQDKVRQLTQINAHFVTAVQTEVTGVSGDMHLSAEDIFGAGSVLNIGGAHSALAVRQKYLQNNPHGIPLVLMDDVIHGYRTIFPIPLAMGCTFDLQLAEQCAQMSAVEAAANGVDVTFSPMVNLPRDARWGRIMESYAEDAYLNGVFGRATVRGYHKGGVGSCVKHFAAYGAAESGKDYNTTEVSEHTLREYYLPAFEECLKEQPEAIMTSFNLLNGIPVNGDTHLLVDILRNQWGYDGVVVSDYGAVVEMINHGFCADQKQCASVSANNQIDLEMMSAAYLHNLPQLVEEGKVSMQTVDGMVRRVLKLKEKLGLFQNPDNKTDVEAAQSLCLCPEHRALAKRAAKSSFVLLENNGVLPLSTDDDIALAGPLATERNILGAWACAGRPAEAVTVQEGICRLLGRSVPCAEGCNLDFFCNFDGLDEAVRIANANKVVVCLGEHSYQSGESASRADISLPRAQVELLRRIKLAGHQTVAVVFGGRPQVLTEAKKYADAILYVWQPGTEGGNAIAEVLFGESPEGKLTTSFPRSVGQCPIYYNHFNTGRPKLSDILGEKYSSSYLDQLNSPLYPFGYGLSYSRFSLGNLTLSRTSFRRGQSVTAQATVTNCGKVPATEVVQLYIRDKFASYARPVKELKGFCKVHLDVGQSRVVEFTLDEQTLAFHRADGTFGAEIGEFDIFIGTDSTCQPFATLLLQD